MGAAFGIEKGLTLRLLESEGVLDFLLLLDAETREQQIKRVVETLVLNVLGKRVEGLVAVLTGFLHSLAKLSHGSLGFAAQIALLDVLEAWLDDRLVHLVDGLGHCQRKETPALGEGADGVFLESVEEKPLKEPLSPLEAGSGVFPKPEYLPP